MLPGDTIPEKDVVGIIAFLYFLCLILIVENGYILVVLASEWARCGTLPPSEKILAFLSASRFFLQWVICGKNLYILLYPMAFYYNPIYQCIYFQWDFFNSVCVWCSALLSVFYCVKIATFTHPVFLWLKWRISRCMTWLLLGSLGISFAIACLFFIGNYYIYYVYSMRSIVSENRTRGIFRRKMERYYFFPLKIVAYSIPATIFFVCMFLLITSLERHRKRMLHSDSGLRDSRTQAHTRALKTLISFFILFTSYFLALMVNASNVLPSLRSWYWGWQVLIHLCTAIHSTILIMNNPRLRGVLERKSCLRDGIF
ncbi:taste receptor type 2 member 60 [Trichosurus vulpecula]|uniref:taste receptor type 2 member 60 n=1 Tax=Trichosurus vulpecula TaxID=9337 RepID=UPI00186B2FA4|nr:taste receptor type 2 member 60 [Trichosurus vulpecula]